jgi:hypothetical protein
VLDSSRSNRSNLILFRRTLLKAINKLHRQKPIVPLIWTSLEPRPSILAAHTHCPSPPHFKHAKGTKRRALRSQPLLTRHFRVARVESGRLRPARRLRAKQRPRRLARPRTPPFHGDNTGSNPVGDANKTKELTEIPCFPRGAVKPLFWPPVGDSLTAASPPLSVVLPVSRASALARRCPS